MVNERWMAHHALVLVFCALGVACTREPAQRPGNGSLGAPDSSPVAAASAQPLASEAPAAPQTALVLSAALVRREPTEARFLPPLGKHRRRSNVTATLYRGEAVWVRAHKDGFLDVTLSDESHGWVKEDGIIVGPHLQLATVLGRSRLFGRPDLLALHGSRMVEPGTLLIVLRQKDQFSEVNYGGQQSAWILSATLLTDSQEVGAAKLVHRARLLQDRHDDGADAIIELLRGQFANTRLFAALQSAQAPVPQTAALCVEDGANDTVNDGSENAVTPPQDFSAAAAPPMQLTPAQAPAPPPPSGGAPGLQGWQPPPSPPTAAPSNDASLTQPAPPDDEI